MVVNPFGGPPPIANPFGAPVAPATKPVANPFGAPNPGANMVGTPATHAAKPTSTLSFGAPAPIQKNSMPKRRNNNAGPEPTEGTRQLSQFAYDYAKKLISHLEKENLTPPKWPQEPGNPKKRAAVEGLKDGYKKYRARVYSSLRKADLIDDPDKRRRLQDALDFKGICEDMCPEFEKVARIAEFDVTSEEKRRPSDGGAPWAEPSIMVKKFARSAAGQDAPLPMDVRSIDTLRRTTDYLIDELLQDDLRLPSMHNYLWDRLRAVRKDFTFHSTKTPAEMKSLVYCFEHIARFHATALHLLSRKGFAEDGFDQKQEIEQLGRTVLSLIEAYDLCHEKKVKCENEAEFRAYYLLLNAFAPSIVQRIPTWGKEYWFDSEEVQIAISLMNAMEDVRSRKGPIKPRRAASVDNSMFTDYFSIVEQPNVSYTMACMAEIHFTSVRQCVLRNLVKGYARHRDAPRHFTAQVLNQFLRFDTPDEAIEFAKQHNFDFSTENPKNPEQEPYMILNSRNRYVPSPRVQQSYSGQIVERKRNGRPLPHVIHNTVFDSTTSTPDSTDSPDGLFVSQGQSSSSTNGGTSQATIMNTMSPFGAQSSPASMNRGAPATSTSPFGTSPFGSLNGQAGSGISQRAPSTPAFPTKSSLFATSQDDQNPKAPVATPAVSVPPFGTPSSWGTAIPPAASGGGVGAGTLTKSALGAPTTGTSILGSSSPFASASPFANSRKQSAPSDQSGSAIGFSLGAPAFGTAPTANASVSGPLFPGTTPFATPASQPPLSGVLGSGASLSGGPSPFSNLNNSTERKAAEVPSFFEKQREISAIKPQEFSIKGLGSTSSPEATTFPPQKPSAQNAIPAALGAAPSNFTGLGPVSTTVAPSSTSMSASSTSATEYTSGVPKERASVSFAATSAESDEPRPNPLQSSGHPKSILKRPQEVEPSVLSSQIFGASNTNGQPNPLGQTVQEATSMMKHDPMGDFAKWFTLGDGGLVEQFTDIVVEDILTKVFTGFQEEEEERRRREEDEQSWKEARQFQVYNLSIKYFYRWRQIAHERRRKAILEEGKRKQREYWANRPQRLKKDIEEAASRAEAAGIAAERKAREDAAALVNIARQSGRSRADAELRYEDRFRLSTASSERSVKEELLATGVFSGMADERGTAHRVVQEAENTNYMPLPRHQLSRSVGSGSFYQKKKSKTDTLREKMGLDKSRRFSASTSFHEGRTNFSASSSFSTSRSRKRSAEDPDEARSNKRLTMFKSLHFEMRARGFVPTTNGGWRHEGDPYIVSVGSSRPASSRSSTTPSSKRKRDLIDEDETITSSPHRRLISTTTESAKEHTLESIEESSRVLQEQLEELRALMNETGEPITG